METIFTGRTYEQKIMKDFLFNKTSELLAIIGRRRVGKTFLIQSVYERNICFSMSGIQHASTEEQLEDFAFQFSKFSKTGYVNFVPQNWLQAFQQLEIYLSKLRTTRKKVVFFDELPWLDKHKSGFLQSLAHFWNTWAVKNNIIVVVCGSSASWMIDKVVYDKGGLHNRITKLIELEPFTLAETETYFKQRKIKLNRYQIIQLYMAMGGIPHYLKEVRNGLSTAQNIDNICFKKNGLLQNEFSKLYPALFNNAEKHIAIIRALATKWKGLTRKEIVKHSKLPDGGSITRLLNDLSTSGFITSYYPFGKKKKDTLYRLTDEYSLFYLHFIEKKRNASWQKISVTQQWKSWCGYAFESLCMKHIGKIKDALHISGVLTEESGFVYKGSKKESGLQIDLLIDRNDNVINICEMKFYAAEFSISKDYAKKLRNKMVQFQEITKTKKQIFLTLISTYGIRKNEHSIGLVDNDITINALF